MGFALTPGEAPLHFSRSKNVMHVGSQQLCRLMLIYTLFTKRIKSVGDLCLQLEPQLSESPWIPLFPELRNILGIIITGCRAAGKTAPSLATLGSS